MSTASVWGRYRKAVAAVVAQLPAPAVLGVLTAAGVHMSAGLVAAVLSLASVALTPTAVAAAKNAPS